MAPVAPIVHYVGLQIFANELHEPVALAGHRVCRRAAALRRRSGGTLPAA
jgi:hypothetical protein